MEEEIKTILIQKLKEKNVRKFNGYTLGLHANHIANALLKKKGIKKGSKEYETQHSKLKDLIKSIHKDLPAQEVSKKVVSSNVVEEITPAQLARETSSIQEVVEPPVVREDPEVARLRKELKEYKALVESSKTIKAELATKIQTAFRRYKELKGKKLGEIKERLKVATAKKTIGKALKKGVEKLREKEEPLTEEQKENIEFMKRQREQRIKEKVFGALKKRTEKTQLKKQIEENIKFKKATTEEEKEAIKKRTKEAHKSLKEMVSEVIADKAKGKSPRVENDKILQVKKLYIPEDYDSINIIHYPDSLIIYKQIYKNEKTKDVITLTNDLDGDISISYLDKRTEYYSDYKDKQKKIEHFKKYDDMNIPEDLYVFFKKLYDRRSPTNSRDAIFEYLFEEELNKGYFDVNYRNKKLREIYDRYVKKYGQP